MSTRRAIRPATELLISASTGVYTDRSPDGSEGASFIALPYASIFGAMVAAPALAAALCTTGRAPVKART